MSYSILKHKSNQPVLVIFKLFNVYKGVETIEDIYWVNYWFTLNIYRTLDHNKISVIENNTFNNLHSLYDL